MRPVPVVLAFALVASGLAFAELSGAPYEAATATEAAAASASGVAWETLPDLPSPRTEAMAVAAAGRVYVIGGLFPYSGPGSDFMGNVSSEVLVWDAASGEWARGPDYPIPVHHAGVVAVGDRVLVVGGHVGPGPFFAPTALAFSLDASLPLAEQRWEPFTPLPTPRGAHVAVADGDTVWIFGGVNALMATASSLERTALKLEGAFADPATVWAPIAEFPDPRDHLAGAVVGRKVYAIGGRDLTLNTNTGRVDVYDPAADAWTRGADMPTARGGIGAAVLGGRIVVFGGEAPQQAFDAAEAYDPAADSWEALAPMPEARHGVGVAVLDGAAHVLAGGPRPAFTYSASHYVMRLA